MNTQKDGNIKMKDFQGNTIIDTLMGDFDTIKRKSKGQDRSKNYHKITISISEKDKLSVMEYAKENNLTVSSLIKDLLRAKSIIH